MPPERRKERGSYADKLFSQCPRLPPAQQQQERQDASSKEKGKGKIMLTSYSAPAPGCPPTSSSRRGRMPPQRRKERGKLC